MHWHQRVAFVSAPLRFCFLHILQTQENNETKIISNTDMRDFVVSRIFFHRIIFFFKFFRVSISDVASVKQNMIWNKIVDIQITVLLSGDHRRKQEIKYKSSGKI